MLTKRKHAHGTRSPLRAAMAVAAERPMDRRAFLHKSGLTAAGVATFASLTFGGVKKVAAGPVRPDIPIVRKKNICTHCSVGCSVIAEEQNGVWVGQEPAFDSPINRGSHCAKGASVRELVKGDRRVKTPLKLVNGEWQKISWDQAVNEIGDKMLEIRQKSGPDSVYLLGSAKFTNEAAYLFRKFAAFWGTNSVDHQARICHSTTVAGVANTWGYGAQTNSYNDIRNAKTMIFMGSNAAEAHPVALQHILTGKETNRANVFVVDPRFTRTAAHATEYVRFRSGTDIAVIWGMLWHIFKNGWEDKDYIEQRVYGMHLVRAEVEKWTPEEVEKVTGIPGEQLKRVAETFAKQRPSTFIWCMGGTQHTVGTANVRAYCTLLLATGNVGNYGTGANIFRGHTNVQGATDLGLDVTSLPLYYGLAESAWRHWARVWDVSYDYLLSRFPNKTMMEAPGIPSTRWFDAVQLPKADVDQQDNVRGMFVMGHGGNTIPRMPESKAGLEKLELLVVIDPHPTTFSVLSDRKNGSYILPACTSFEMDGSRTASNRSLQWGEQVVKPIFESKNDYEIMYLFAKKLGFGTEMFKTLKVDGNVPEAESILKEINKGGLSTGYSGQSPERLKAHMANQDKFDVVTLKAKDGPLKGEYYGLPWPCWGTPEMKHCGTHTLYNINLHVKDGGGTFRARFGVTYDEVQKDNTKTTVNLLSGATGPLGAELSEGYPEFTYGILKKLGWDKDLTADEVATIQRIGGNNADAVGWATDLSAGIIRVAMEHGCIPYGNGKARVYAWNLPDPIPVHREPIYTSRPELVAKYPTRPDAKQFRVPNIGFTVQKDAVDKGLAKQFPIILTSGRLVEYEGGGEETRSNPWLAELQQDMFVEINPSDAAERGIKEGQMVWVYGPAGGSKARVKAMVTERVGKGVAFMPFHFAGFYQGTDQRSKYPKSADPIVLGESVNTITTYGYDPVTGMHEGKATLCQIAAA